MYIKCTTTNSTLSIAWRRLKELYSFNHELCDRVTKLGVVQICKKGEDMIIIDYKDTRPIYEQIVERFKSLMLKGAMQPDEQMPSVRNLAMELSINPNTIQKAYAELERQGFIYTVKGRGSFVSGDNSLVDKRKKEYIEQILTLVREVLEIGLTKQEIILEIEKLQM